MDELQDYNGVDILVYSHEDIDYSREFLARIDQGINMQTIKRNLRTIQEVLTQFNTFEPLEKRLNRFPLILTQIFGSLWAI